MKILLILRIFCLIHFVRSFNTTIPLPERSSFPFDPQNCDNTPCDASGEVCNWDAKNCIAKWVYEQGKALTCAALVTTDLLTSLLAIRTGQLVDLSAQMAYDCLHDSTKEDDRKVVEYLFRIKENRDLVLVKESAYGDGIFHDVVNHCQKPREEANYHIANIKIRASVTIKQLINQLSKGPIAGNICESKRFEKAKCEVYIPDEQDFLEKCPDWRMHSVLIYGYERVAGSGVNLLLKNSDGFDWGCMGKIKFFVAPETHSKQIILTFPSWAEIIIDSDNQNDFQTFYAFAVFFSETLVSILDYFA